MNWNEHYKQMYKYYIIIEYKFREILGHLHLNLCMNSVLIIYPEKKNKRKGSLLTQKLVPSILPVCASNNFDRFQPI